MSDTPRTDAAEQRVKGPNAWAPHDYRAVPADFARTLERELAAANAALKVAVEQLADAYEFQRRIAEEND